MRTAIVGGRKTRPTIKLGICGEHGGDPSSVEFCHQLGLDYVSCSPYRVGIARLAAAQAALAEAEAEKAKPKKAKPSSTKLTRSKPAKKAATRASAKARPSSRRVTGRPKRTKR